MLRLALKEAVEAYEGREKFEEGGAFEKALVETSGELMELERQENRVLEPCHRLYQRIIRCLQFINFGFQTIKETVYSCDAILFGALRAESAFLGAFGGSRTKLSYLEGTIPSTARNVGI